MDFNVNVYLQNNDFVRQLEAERDEALRQVASCVLRMGDLERRLVDEQHVNLQLIDLLRNHGIRYRPSADMRTWDWNK